jgi:anaerobic dimethyl sulfoxide reductase subunit A
MFNDRGATLVSAFVTPRIRPRVVAIWEGSWFSPQEPGNCDSIDVAGAANVLIDRRQPEAVCDGMLNNALVEVQRLVQ